MYLLFDIGGSNMRISTSNETSILQTKIIPAPQDFEEALASFKKLADELAGPEKIESVAGGIAGPLDKEKTMLVASSHLPGWINKPWKARLADLFECPVYLENDSALGGLGEATFGAGKDHQIVAYIAIGTGVGGARIVNGKIDTNSLGFEPGHQIILPNGSACNCGGKGHLETLVGGFYLERTYKIKAENIKDEAVWNEVSKYLAIGLNNTIVHWSSDIIILGGSVSQSIPIDRVNNFLKEFCTVFPNPPEVIKGTLGDEAGLYGALKLLK